ncbi:MAG: SDR family oxidoreductase [Gemmataceae bacterium]
MPVKLAALITGSGRRRVGWHVADAFVRRGYSVALHYRTSGTEAEASAAEFRARGVDAYAVPADLRDENQVMTMIASVLDRFGRLDSLVNCAAIWKRQTLEKTTAADLREHFDTNTLGTFLCAKYAGLEMVKQNDGGCIINIGDWAEVRPYPDYSAYFASKGGVTALTRSLAVEFGLRNPRVRVNCVLPGPVMIPDDLPEAERRQAIDATLVKREGRPGNIAQAVLSLIDNDFVTGVCLPIDGGRTVYAPEGECR